MNYMTIINISIHHYRETRSTVSVFFPVFLFFLAVIIIAVTSVFTDSASMKF